MAGNGLGVMVCGALLSRSLSFDRYRKTKDLGDFFGIVPSSDLFSMGGIDLIEQTEHSKLHILLRGTV